MIHQALRGLSAADPVMRRIIRECRPERCQKGVNGIDRFVRSGAGCGMARALSF
jgi:hypothetical protein